MMMKSVAYRKEDKNTPGLRAIVHCYPPLSIKIAKDPAHPARLLRAEKVVQGRAGLSQTHSYISPGLLKGGKRNI
jgi:hypothetical protein